MLRNVKCKEFPYKTSLFPPIFYSLLIEFNTTLRIMELELGLKLTKVVDDFAAAELLITKDRTGPVFLCTQTDHVFFLTAHLKGYRRNNIKIDINEDGSRIAISGEKPVQEMVMVGWQVVKKETEMRGFRKVFKIPGVVILDKVEARFNEDESVLTVSMPKLVKGVTGVGIEELKEEEMPRGETESLQVVADGVTKSKMPQLEECADPMGVHQVEEIDRTMQLLPELPEQTQPKLEREEVQKMAPTKAKMVGTEYLKPEKLKGEKMEKESKEMETIEATRVEPDQVTQQKEIPSIAPVLDEQRPPDGTFRLDKESQEKGTQTEDITQDIQEQEKPRYDQAEPTCLKQPSDEDHVTHVVYSQEVGGTEQGIEEENEAGSADDEPFWGEQEELHDQLTDKVRRKKSKKICAPAIIVGSSLLVSLVVFVIHLIRVKNQTNKKRD